MRMYHLSYYPANWDYWCASKGNMAKAPKGKRNGTVLDKDDLEAVLHKDGFETALDKETIVDNGTAVISSHVDDNIYANTSVYTNTASIRTSKLCSYYMMYLRLRQKKSQKFDGVYKDHFNSGGDKDDLVVIAEMQPDLSTTSGKPFIIAEGADKKPGDIMDGKQPDTQHTTQPQHPICTTHHDVGHYIIKTSDHVLFEEAGYGAPCILPRYFHDNVDYGIYERQRERKEQF